MTALPHREVLPPPSLRKHRQKRHRARSHQAIAAEAVVKILVHSSLSIASVVAMFKLMPYQQVQLDKLQEIRLRVQETETRVNQLSQEFNRNFDARQTKSLMQEQSYRVDPNRRRVFFLNNSAAHTPTPSLHQARR
jgi:hypothetical protein